MHYTTAIKDVFRQIMGRIVALFSGLVLTVLVAKSLDPLRYGDYITILNYFTLRSALADWGLYSAGLRELSKIKLQYNITDSASFSTADDSVKYIFSVIVSEFVWSRLLQIVVVYSIAIIVAYMIPSYSSNVYMLRGLPFGMVFSALFAMASILQLPFQLFWKMEYVSIGLIISRISQIFFLLLIVYSGFWKLDGDHVSLSLFVMILLSIVLSGFLQIVYTLFMKYPIVPLRKVSFLYRMWDHIKDNAKYGMTFFLSSFCLLLVGLLLSVFYPTVDGYIYVGIRGLAFQLIQMLFIVPSSLANVMIHKITSAKPLQQAHAFGQMLLIIIWFGGLCLSNFIIFAPQMIYAVSGPSYLSVHGIVRTVDGLRLLFATNFTFTQFLGGADIILPFLGLVLLLNFVKTVFSYIFVAAKRQDVLFFINIVGIGAGFVLAILLVYEYAIWGGIFAQILMEFIFVGCFLLYAYKYSILPHFSFAKMIAFMVFFITISVLGFAFPLFYYTERFHFVVCFLFYNIIVFSLRYPSIKSLFKSMSNFSDYGI